MRKDSVKLLVSDALTRNYIVVKKIHVLNMQLSAALKRLICSLHHL